MCSTLLNNPLAVTLFFWLVCPSSSFKNDSYKVNNGRKNNLPCHQKHCMIFHLDPDVMCFEQHHFHPEMKGRCRGIMCSRTWNLKLYLLFDASLVLCIFGEVILLSTASLVHYIFGGMHLLYGESLVWCILGMLHLWCPASLVWCIPAPMHLWRDASLV